MPTTEFTISTRDGECPATLARPSGHGPWPGVLMFMDGAGYRPSLKTFAQKIADLGYVVLLPDTFYRYRPYPALDFTRPLDEAARAQRFRMLFGASALDAMSGDHPAFISALEADPDVKPGRIGTTGYCMGGRMSLMCAALFPDRVAAACAFHPGNLVGDIAGDSLPPRLPDIKAQVLVAMATDDPFFTDVQQAEFLAAFTDAKVVGECSQWPATHGWTMPDAPMFNPEQADRHWQELAHLFAETLS